MKFNPQSRRNFLQGLGGASLLIPVLPSLIQKAHAQTTARPIRFIGFVSKWGQFYENWWPKVTPQKSVGPGAYAMSLKEIKGDLSPIFNKRFDPYRSNLTFTRGLDAMCPIGHNYSVPLTSSYSGNSETDAPSFPASLDAIMERSSKVYPTREPMVRALRLAPTVSGNFSWWQLKKLSYLANNEAVFNQLFANLKGGAQTIVDQDKKTQATLVDSVLTDFNRVRNGRQIALEDKTLLENFVDHLQETQKKIIATSSFEVTCGRPTQVATSGQKNMDAQYTNAANLMVAALACDMTRVGCIAIPVVKKDRTSPDNDWHKYTHQEPSRAEGIRMSLQMNTWVADQYFYLISKLASMSDSSGGTLLDSTMVLWTNELAEGIHTHNNMPVVIAGGSNCLNTGQILDYEQRPKRSFGSGSGKKSATNPIGQPYNGLLMDLMRAMGVTQKEWELTGAGKGFGQYSAAAYWKDYLATKNTSLPGLLRS